MQETIYPRHLTTLNANTRGVLKSIERVAAKGRNSLPNSMHFLDCHVFKERAEREPGKFKEVDEVWMKGSSIKRKETKKVNERLGIPATWPTAFVRIGGTANHTAAKQGKKGEHLEAEGLICLKSLEVMKKQVHKHNVDRAVASMVV